MLKPKYESYGYAVSYPIYTIYNAQKTKALQDAADLALQLPYGVDVTGFTAGMIGQFITDTNGATSLTVSTGTAPSVIFADNFIDTMRSGQISAYLLCQNNVFIVSGCYDIGQNYVVNTLLTVIPSGVNQGKMTPATNYSTEPIVAMVITPPASAANDDPMEIVTMLSLENSGQ